MSLSLFGLRVVTGGRRAISGPFIEYFCDISRSQLQRSKESATGGGQSNLQVLGSRKYAVILLGIASSRQRLD